jgi:RHS repeat-associated protein
MPGVEGHQFVVASADGAQLFFFDLEGRHLQTLDAVTGDIVRTFGYDANGLLSQISEITGGSNNVTVIQHDSTGNPTAIVSPFGLVTHLAVDANGFLAGVTNPAGNQQLFGYTADGLLTTYIDPRGKTNTFQYDSQGRLFQDADALGGSQTLVRAEASKGFSVTRTTTLGRKTTYVLTNLTAKVQRRIITEQDGTTQQSTETIDAGTTHAVSADGTVSDVTLSPDPRFGMQSAFVGSSKLSFPSGLIINLTRASSALLGNPSDPLSLQTSMQTTAVNGLTNTLTYNALNRTTVATSPLSRTVTSSFDALGRLTLIAASGIEAATSTYDNRGRFAAIVKGTGPSARTNRFSYNAQGFLESITDSLGRSVHYSYDAAGRTTQKVFPDGQVMAYGYDAAGNLTSLTPPGRSAYTLAYTDRNELASITPPSVAGTGPISFTHDVDGALVSVSRPDGQTITIGRDSAGRAASRVLSTSGVTNSVVVFSYDPTTGKVSGVAGPGGISLSYKHDGSLLTSETWSGPISGAVNRTYDGFLRIATESVSGDSPVQFSYDSDGLLIGAGNLTIARNLANGLPTNSVLDTIRDERTLDSFGRSLQYDAKAGSSALYEVAYTRDALNRLRQKVETVAGTTTTLIYTYDLAGRLTDVSANGVAAEHYEYDANGNRTTATVRGASVSATYDAQDRLLQYGNDTFTYNGAGDLLDKTNGNQVTTYQRDEFGNLLGVSLPGGAAIAYLLDGLDRRVGKLLNGSLVKGYLYGYHTGPVAELDGTGAVASRFVYAGGLAPAYLVKGGVAYRIVTDQVGSVRLVINSTTGAVVQRLDYDAFGKVLTDTNPGFQPFGFAGGLYDPDTGLVLFGLRDYDAETGRWTSKDPAWFAGCDSNLYRYVRGNPVNSVDPTGLGLLPEVIDNSVQDPLDFYGGMVEASLEAAIVGPALVANPALGVAALLYLEDHPVLDPIQSALDSNLVDTQSSVFSFGKAILGMCLGGVAGEAGAAEEGAGELESEVTQVVRRRINPVRPFAPEQVKIISTEQANQNIGKIIDALFDEMPGGGPPK